MTRFQSTDATTLRAVVDGMKPEPEQFPSEPWAQKYERLLCDAEQLAYRVAHVREALSDLPPNPRKPELIAAIKQIKEVLG